MPPRPHIRSIRTRCASLAALVLLSLFVGSAAHASNGTQDSSDLPIVRLEGDASGFAGILPKEAAFGSLSRPSGPDATSQVPEPNVSFNEDRSSGEMLSVRRKARRHADQPLYCLYRAYLI